jgi:hypothetical protein
MFPIPSRGACKILAVRLGDHGMACLIQLVAEYQRPCMFTPPSFEATLHRSKQAAGLITGLLSLQSNIF